MLPDCYDPVYQEEQRQAEWDEFVEDLPICDCCSRSVYPGDKYYETTVKKVTIVMCARCKSDLNDSEIILDT